MQSLQSKHNTWINRRLDRTQERINKLEDKTKKISSLRHKEIKQ